MPLSSAIIGIVSAATAAGVSAYELTNQPSAPKAPTAITNQTQQAEAQQSAALAQAQALQKRRGLASTILTSPQGVSGGTQTQSATLGT